MGGRSAREKELAKPTDKVVRGTAIEPPFSTESESIGGAPVRRGSAVPVAPETALDGREWLAPVLNRLAAADRW